MATSPENTAAALAAYHLGRDGLVLQQRFDVAVVMPTILRPELPRAVRSVFAQEGVSRIHLLIGVDAAVGDRSVLDAIRKGGPEGGPDGVPEGVPEGVLVTVLDPRYSTSQRHGGMHPAYDGGALRTILCYLANAPAIAFLDDDNWWAPDHLASLLAALQGKDWAFSLRWYVDPESGTPLAVDRLESVGPGRGGYARALGGWVDPNCLMLDARACEPVFRLWSRPLQDDPTHMTADRHIFDTLKTNPRVGETDRATCYYTINPADTAHEKRMAWIERQKRG